ncbi:MAG TPA: transporter substrate-binding domain-containing protein [Steroidobacteraceae bacterium]|nr:transporter substrate-binding domain-containing protein [Steroidobacteraceae bacterium]
MLVAARAVAGLLLAVGWLAANSAHAGDALPAGVLVDDQSLVAGVLAVADERLSLMPAVAAAKWPDHLPVADPVREAAVIAAVGDGARRFGLAREPVERLLSVQIRIARAAQQRLYERWQRGGFDYVGPGLRLGADLRPRLDRLTDRLLETLYLAAPVLGRADFVGWAAELARTGLPAMRWTEDDRGELLATLAAVRFTTPASVDRARTAGLLRIGTPGDYAPFSIASGATVTGSDVELALRFATALGLRPVFVHTTWGALLEDLRTDRFDLAVGGISVTSARRMAATFSVPTARSGKTAVGRCADARRFPTLPAIDAPQVTVVVNPGGTNELFVHEHVKTARVVVHPDNRTILDEIEAGRADVMFTDETEVALATHRHHELCRLLKDAFEPTDKAWLVAKESGWTDVVNRWLQAELQGGTPARLLREYLAR